MISDAAGNGECCNGADNSCCFFISFCNHDLVFLNIVGTSDSNQFCFDLVSSSLVFCRR